MKIFLTKYNEFLIINSIYIFRRYVGIKACHEFDFHQDTGTEGKISNM